MKDEAESFVWSDCEFEEVAHSAEEQQLTITLTDFRSERWSFVFLGIERLTITEPIYCIRSSHSKQEGKKHIALYDDDQAVIAFRYSGVMRYRGTRPSL